MPQIERWDNLPEGVRQHLIERMRDRAISVSDLNQLRLWVETRPQVLDGNWYQVLCSPPYLPAFPLSGNWRPKPSLNNRRGITFCKM